MDDRSFFKQSDLPGTVEREARWLKEAGYSYAASLMNYLYQELMGLRGKPREITMDRGAVKSALLQLVRVAMLRIGGNTAEAMREAMHPEMEIAAEQAAYALCAEREPYPNDHRDRLPPDFLEKGLRMARGSVVFGVALESLTREELLAVAAQGWRAWERRDLGLGPLR